MSRRKNVLGSKVRESKPGGCMLYGFFLVFAVVGGAMFYFLTWKPMWGLLMAQRWAETTCLIESSEVAESRGSDSTTYRVAMTYSYQYQGETYEGDRYDWSVGSSSGYSGKARAVAAHPPGSRTRCYVDPADPLRSVIRREPGLFLLWGLFPLPFVAVGVVGLLYLLSPAGQRSRKQPGTARAAVSAAVRAAVRPDEPAVHGTLELAAEASPVAKLVGVLVFAAFWNGIVSVFVFGQVIPGIRRGDVDWFLTLFMVPFVLIGLGAIAFAFYQLLALFNPRPRLTLEDGHLTPGGSSPLRWQFTGRAERIQKLTLELEGREVVRYRRGTHTHTDRHVFYTAQLASAQGRFGAVERGHASVEIPRRTMPTFESDNNKIEWRLKLRGDVPFWPDVIEDFSITVYPS